MAKKGTKAKSDEVKAPATEASEVDVPKVDKVEQIVQSTIEGSEGINLLKGVSLEELEKVAAWVEKARVEASEKAAAELEVLRADYHEASKSLSDKRKQLESASEAEFAGMEQQIKSLEHAKQKRQAQVKEELASISKDQESLDASAKKSGIYLSPEEKVSLGFLKTNTLTEVVHQEGSSWVTVGHAGAQERQDSPEVHGPVAKDAPPPSEVTKSQVKRPASPPKSFMGVKGFTNVCQYALVDPKSCNGTTKDPCKFSHERGDIVFLKKRIIKLHGSKPVAKFNLHNLLKKNGCGAKKPKVKLCMAHAVLGEGCKDGRCSLVHDAAVLLALCAWK